MYAAAINKLCLPTRAFRGIERDQSNSCHRFLCKIHATRDDNVHITDVPLSHSEIPFISLRRSVTYSLYRYPILLAH